MQIRRRNWYIKGCGYVATYSLVSTKSRAEFVSVNPPPQSIHVTHTPIYISHQPSLNQSIIIPLPHSHTYHIHVQQAQPTNTPKLLFVIFSAPPQIDESSHSSLFPFPPRPPKSGASRSERLCRGVDICIGSIDGHRYQNHNHSLAFVPLPSSSSSSAATTFAFAPTAAAAAVEVGVTFGLFPPRALLALSSPRILDAAMNLEIYSTPTVKRKVSPKIFILFYFFSIHQPKISLSPLFQKKKRKEKKKPRKKKVKKKKL